MTWDEQIAEEARLDAKAARYGRVTASSILSLLLLVIVAGYVLQGHTIPLWTSVEIVGAFTGAWFLLRFLVHFMLVIAWTD